MLFSFLFALGYLLCFLWSKVLSFCMYDVCTVVRENPSLSCLYLNLLSSRRSSTQGGPTFDSGSDRQFCIISIL
jgi:hypothetical protein